MKKISIRYAVAACLIICGIGISIISGNKIMAAESGLSAAEVRSAMLNQGIRAGAIFELNSKQYLLKNVSVNKTGPDTFIVSVTAVAVNDPK